MSAISVNVAAVPRTALSIEEACASLGVSWDTWNEHIAPEIRIVRLGRRQLIPVAELQRWLEKNGMAARNGR
jgi:excisionase family DNA binding protein